MPELSIAVIYRDEHLMEILITATNDRFSGVSVVYLSGSGQELIEFGNRLEGFPKNINQVEEVEFGFTQKDRDDFQQLLKANPIARAATACIGLKFYCIDSIGHPAVFVTLHEDNWSERSEAVGKASFEMRFEPAQLDNFVEEVLELGTNKEGAATLQGIADGKASFI